MHKYLNPRNYLRYFLNRFIAVTSIALKPLEKYLMQKYEDEGIKRYPPIFIIGAPRTGSTIFYQTITNYWDVGYVNNFECSNYKNIILATIISDKIFNKRCHNNFQSHHGATKGLNSPSECGELWYRWFPRNKHFVDKDELNFFQRLEMRRVVNGLICVKKKPVFFKNMNCGQRIRALYQIFPEAIFLHCTRNPLYAAQSLLETRKRVYGNYNSWWSIMPREYDDLQSLDPCEQVVAQIYYIEKEIKDALEKYYSKRYVRLEYENFCENPLGVLQIIKAFFERLGVNVNPKKEYQLYFIANNITRTDLPVINDLRKYISEYFE